MRTFNIPYGSSSQTLNLPDDANVTWIDPADVDAPGIPGNLIPAALAAPLGDFAWDDYSPAACKVGIAINDNTRPVPHHLLLPPLLEYLAQRGFSHNQIRLFIANGTHRPMIPAQYPDILSEEIIKQYSIVSHSSDDADGLLYLGDTPAGSPVWVNREFYASDLKIVVGNIEPHHFAGFSGGVKSAAIGLAGRTTINANHVLLLQPGSKAGIYSGNPLREDIEQIGSMMNVHAALNIVMNTRKQPLAAFFGAPLAVMEAGIPLSRQVSQTSVDGLFDIVISSPGGLPKDINFYQAQKAITHAARIVRPGGVIILCAACPQGAGSPGYVNFMDGVTSHAAVLEKFQREGFQVGPHKAVQVAIISQQARIILVSGLPDDLGRTLLLEPAASVQVALEMANPSAQARIALLPHATNTIPIVVSA